MKNEKNIFIKILIYFLLFGLTVTILFPIFFMFINSFKEKKEYFTNMYGLVKNLSLVNYKYILIEMNFITYLKNSIVMVSLALMVVIVVAVMASYALAKIPFWGSSAVVQSLISGMMVPSILLLIPLYLTYAKLGMLDTIWGLSLFCAGTALPFSVYLLTQAMRDIPNELIEAVKIDGGRLFHIFKVVTIPCTKPMIITMIALNFLGFWNEYLFAILFIQTDDKRILTVAVKNIMASKFASNIPALLTGLLINIVPILIVFFIANKSFEKGLVAGAVKG